MSVRIYAPARRFRLAPLALAAAVACAVGWIATQRRERPSTVAPPVSESASSVGGNTMGGTWSVKLIRPHPATENLRLALQHELDRLEDQLSTYRPASLVSRLDACHDTDWFPVSPELAELVNNALDVSEQTAGAFDITVAPLVNLWGFGPQATGLRRGTIPTDDEIAVARHHVGHARLHARLSPPGLRKDDPDLSIDLSAIAKGYAAGRLAILLDRQHITDYLIAVGGDLRARGQSPLGRPWHVGIETPTPDLRRILRRIELRDAALSTSGDYRNFVDVAGRRFSHEIDPRTGRPIINGPASVTVLHPDSARADALATALMVLGPDEGFDRARQLGIAALFVLRAGERFETRATPAFAPLLIDAADPAEEVPPVDKTPRAFEPTHSRHPGGPSRQP